MTARDEDILYFHQNNNMDCKQDSNMSSFQNCINETDNNQAFFDDDEVSLSFQDLVEGKMNIRRRSSSINSAEDTNIHSNFDLAMANSSHNQDEARSMQVGAMHCSNAEGAASLFASPTHEPKVNAKEITPGQAQLPTCPDSSSIGNYNPTNEEVMTYVNHVSQISPLTPLTPVPHHLQKKTTLAALYHSSRRSRNTPQSSASIPKPPIHGFPIPPPPFASRSPAGIQRKSNSNVISNNDSVSQSLRSSHSQSIQSSFNPSLWSKHSQSLHSSHSQSLRSSHSQSLQSSLLNSSNSSSMSRCHDSWGTSMSSLMGSSNLNASLNIAAPLYSSQRSSNMAEDHSDSAAPPLTTGPMVPQAPSPFSTSNDIGRHTHNYSPSINSIDPNLLELANLSSENMCMERLSRFSLQKVRSRTEFEDTAGKDNMDDSESMSSGNNETDNDNAHTGESGCKSDLPPRKKKKNSRKSLIALKDEGHIRTETFQVETKMGGDSLVEREAPLTPDTFKSIGTNTSFDVMLALASSNASAIGQDLEREMLNDDVPKRVVAKESPKEGRDEEMNDATGCQDTEEPRQDNKKQQKTKHHYERHDEEDTPSVKHRRRVRRKIQRLLLIRHATSCPIPPPPPTNISVASSSFTVPTSNATSNDNALHILASSTAAVGAYTSSADAAQQSIQNVCPVTTHCAEGKRLCAHIRTCKNESCRYRKCLTSREVLGHYRSCRDRSCEICGPVRALPVKKKATKQQQNCLKDHLSYHSDSSLETIDDEEWAYATMNYSSNSRMRSNLAAEPRAVVASGGNVTEGRSPSGESVPPKQNTNASSMARAA